MSLTLALYLIDVFGSLKQISIVVMCLTVALGLVCVIGATCEGSKVCMTYLKVCVATLFTTAIVHILTPSTQTMYLMLGASTAKEIVENPKVQEVGGKVMAIINDKLDTMLPPSKESK